MMMTRSFQRFLPPSYFLGQGRLGGKGVGESSGAPPSVRMKSGARTLAPSPREKSTDLPSIETPIAKTTEHRIIKHLSLEALDLGH